MTLEEQFVTQLIRIAPSKETPLDVARENAAAYLDVDTVARREGMNRVQCHLRSSYLTNIIWL